MQTRVLFEPGQEVDIIDQSGEAVGNAKVIRDTRSEIQIEEISNGAKSEFKHDSFTGGWKLLFEGLGGETCFSRNGPIYFIKPKNIKGFEYVFFGTKQSSEPNKQIEHFELHFPNETSAEEATKRIDTHIDELRVNKNYKEVTGTLWHRRIVKNF